MITITTLTDRQVNSVEIFEHFASDFEAAVIDDNWRRLAKYLSDNSTYLNVGGPDKKVKGARAIIAYLKEDIANTDRRFDTRTLVGLDDPFVDKDYLSRKWRCTYTLAGAPPLIIEGEARYRFKGNVIHSIEEQPTTESMEKVNDWMQKYADMLRDL